MSIRTQSAWIGAVCASFALGAAHSHACSCLRPTVVEEQFDIADVVFFGRVASQNVVDNERRIDFQVLTSWKGVTTPTITLTTAASCAGCGIGPDNGDEILVYAIIDTMTGGVVTDLCTRTGERGAPLEDIEEFQSLGFDPIVRYGDEPTFLRLPCGLGMTFGIASCTFALVAVGGIRRIGRYSKTHMA